MAKLVSSRFMRNCASVEEKSGEKYRKAHDDNFCLYAHMHTDTYTCIHMYTPTCSYTCEQTHHKYTCKEVGRERVISTHALCIVTVESGLLLGVS